MITEQDIEKIMQWCYKNNMIEFKNSQMKLGILDGGILAISFFFLYTRKTMISQ